MDLVVRCSVIIHNMIVEVRDTDEENGFGTNNIASIEQDAAIVTIINRSIPSNQCANDEYLRTVAKQVENCQDQELLKNAIADAIWDRHGTAATAITVRIALDSSYWEEDSDYNST